MSTRYVIAYERVGLGSNDSSYPSTTFYRIAPPLPPCTQLGNGGRRGLIQSQLIFYGHSDAPGTQKIPTGRARATAASPASSDRMWGTRYTYDLREAPRRTEESVLVAARIGLQFATTSSAWFNFLAFGRQRQFEPADP